MTRWTVSFKASDGAGVRCPELLREGAETIAFFALFCLFPGFFPTLAIVFAALCLVTVLQRFILAAKSFS
jgi:hypothetical protein